MALVPILILFLGSLFTWFARHRSERVLWTFNSGVALLAWMVSLFLVMSVPSVISLSVWRPVALFTSRLELHLDSVGWLLLYATTTVTVSVTFGEATRPGSSTATTKSIILSYSALAMIAMLAGNLLTVAMAWALMDILTLFFNLRVQEENFVQQHITRLAVDGGGILLILSATLLNGSVGGRSSLSVPLESTLAAVFLVVAALLRLGLLPPRVNLLQLPLEHKGFGTLLQILPPVTALSLLTRMLNMGIPLETLPWLRLAGGIGVVIGGLRWTFEKDLVRARSFLVLGISGLGVLAASINLEAGGAPMAAAGAVLLLSGVVISLSEVYSPSHRLWPGLAGILLAGLPGTPGAVIAESLVPTEFGGFPLALRFLGLFGLTLLAAGAFRYVFQPTRPWPTGESLVRVVYGLGLALPIFVAIGLGLRMPGSLSIRAGILFMLAAGLAVLGIIWLRRLPRQDVDRWGRLMSWLDPSPIYRVVWGGVGAMVHLFRAIGDILEGEGAMLWMLVVLLLVFLAVGRIPG